MKVKLSEVVDKISGNEDRFTTDLEYYLAGEHYESERIAIYKKGIIKDNLNTLGFKFHFRFNAGDTIFMSRNPHLKKAGMVTYDGICSDTSYILRTKNQNTLLESYLPLVLQNDRFWHWFEENKSGSVNYLLNWKTLKEYEFDLPSIDEQQRISDLIWSIEKARTAYEQLLIVSDEMIKSQFIEMFGNPITNDKGWNVKPLKEVAPEHRPDIPKQDKYWWLNLDMIESFSGFIIERVEESIENIGNSTGTFDNTMVLYSKLRPYLNKVVVPDDFGYATTELVGMQPNEEVLNKFFLFNLLRGDEFVAFADSLSAGGQMPRMPMKDLRSFQCILPPIELQNEFVRLYQQSDKSKIEIKESINKLNELSHSLLCENFR